MRRTDFCRAEQARRRRVAHAPKLSQDGFKAEGDMPGDVFKEYPFRRTFPDDTGDLGPEVARIVGTAALSGRAERLARISGEEDVECTAEAAGIEGSQVIPDWGLGEIPGALGGDEDGTRPIFPLDKGARVIAGLCEHEAHIQASATCAEG